MEGRVNDDNEEGDEEINCDGLDNDAANGKYFNTDI